LKSNSCQLSVKSKQSPKATLSPSSPCRLDFSPSGFENSFQLKANNHPRLHYHLQASPCRLDFSPSGFENSFQLKANNHPRLHYHLQALVRWTLVHQVLKVTFS
jgi:hypothetical protein